jgi:FkbM family methyltransferase
MTTLTSLRDALASVSRAAPHFRGKGRLGLALTSLLSDLDDEQTSIVEISMKDGSRMRLDLRSFERIAFFLGQYDDREIRGLVRLLDPGSVVLDVGANIGFYSISILMRQRSRSDLHIHAFEPVPQNFARLCYHIEANGLRHNITAVNVALGSHAGQICMQMTDRGRTSSGNAVQVASEGNGSLPGQSMAQLTTLDEYAVRHDLATCDLVKVDIEGAELGFLKGGEAFLSRTRPVIFSEYNPASAAEFGYELQDISALVRPWTYRTYLPTRDGRLEPITGPLNSLTNFFLVPDERFASVQKKYSGN